MENPQSTVEIDSEPAAQPALVHLRLHTEYSLVDSMVRIKPLMKAVGERDMAAVAMMDRCNLFAMVKFFRAAQGVGSCLGQRCVGGIDGAGEQQQQCTQGAGSQGRNSYGGNSTVLARDGSLAWAFGQVLLSYLDGECLLSCLRLPDLSRNSPSLGLCGHWI